MYSLAPDTYKVSRSDVGRDALLDDSFSESLRRNLKNCINFFRPFRQNLVRFRVAVSQVHLAKGS